MFRDLSVKTVSLEFRAHTGCPYVGPYMKVSLKWECLGPRIYGKCIGIIGAPVGIV